MTEPFTTVGIDCRNDEWRIARVRHDGGRPTIERLERCDNGQLSGCEAIKSERIALAVPDDRALVKTLHLNGGGDRSRLAAFEMAQAVLADETTYVFDAYPSGLGGMTIGSAIRREILTEAVIAPFQRAAGSDLTPSPMLRSIALGRGYVTFAAPESGELIALADIACDPIPLCLIHGGRPVSVGHLASDRFDLTGDQGREHLAIELKTVISFKLAALFEDGLTRPLSALLIAGAADDSPVCATLARYFSLPVAVPRLNTGFLADPETADPAGGDFLAALGLASI